MTTRDQLRQIIQPTQDGGMFEPWRERVANDILAALHNDARWSSHCLDALLADAWSRGSITEALDWLLWCREQLTAAIDALEKQERIEHETRGYLPTTRSTGGHYPNAEQGPGGVCEP